MRRVGRSFVFQPKICTKRKCINVYHHAAQASLVYTWIEIYYIPPVGGSNTKVDDQNPSVQI
jgi:hypothetical protein